MDAPPARTVDVAAVLDSGRLRGLPLLVSAFTVLALVFDGFDLQALAFVLPALLDEWGVERSVFGPVLAAALVGQALGAFALGSLGDRYGRRVALCGSMLVVALGTLGAALSTGPTELAVYRLVTGLGLGGSVPNATALMLEFSPRASRNLLVALTVVGVPIGGMVGAEIAAHVLPAFGWRAVFYIGAALPAVLVFAMLWWLPESPRFLAQRADRAADLAALLDRVDPRARYRPEDRFVVPEPDLGVRAPGPGALFTRALARHTLTIWAIFFTNIFAVYAYFNWLPTVLRASGLSMDVALRGALFFNLGGVAGAIASALVMNRSGSRPVVRGLAVLSVASALVLAFLPVDPAVPGLAGSGIAALLAVMTVAGFAVLGLQVTMYTVAANAYPTAARATGVGWALGIARVGGILSSFAGAGLLAFAQGPQTFFVGVALVLVLTVAGVFALASHVAPTR